jgi:hypothetical protein
MPLAAHVPPHHHTPTADLPHTFVEHEALKAILLAGQNHFDIQSVCDVRTSSPRRACERTCLYAPQRWVRATLTADTCVERPTQRT